MTDETVGVTVVRNQAEAEVICGMLREHGIKCAYQQTNFGAGSMDGFPGGLQEVLVAEGDAKRAQELIGPPGEG